VWLCGHDNCLPDFCTANLFVHFRHQPDHVAKGIARGFQHYDGHLKSRQILLIRQALIHRHQHVERLLCSPQQFRVADSCPPLLRHGHNLDVRVEMWLE